MPGKRQDGQCRQSCGAPAPNGLPDEDGDGPVPLADAPPSPLASVAPSLPSSNSARKLAPISSTPVSSLRSRCNRRCTCRPAHARSAAQQSGEPSKPRPAHTGLQGAPVQRPRRTATRVPCPARRPTRRRACQSRAGAGLHIGVLYDSIKHAALLIKEEQWLRPCSSTPMVRKRSSERRYLWSAHRWAQHASVSACDAAPARAALCSDSSLQQALACASAGWRMAQAERRLLRRPSATSVLVAVS